MKLLFDEGLSPKLALSLRDLFPESESALSNGLIRSGDRKILDCLVANDLILVSTDSDFESLQKQVPGPKVVILRSCDTLPTSRLMSFGVMPFGSQNWQIC